MRRHGLISTPNFLDGLYLAAGSVSDLALVIEGPECGHYKQMRAGPAHDLASTLMHRGNPRAVSTRLIADDYIFGTEPGLVRTLREASLFLNPAAILVSQSGPVQLLGANTHDMLADLESELETPLLFALSASLSGDFLDGWAAAMNALAGSQFVKSGPLRPKSAVIFGHLLDRLEADRTADLAEMVELARAGGLEQVTAWPDGGSLNRLSELAGVEYVLTTPYARDAGRALAARLNAELIDTDIPAGPAGCADFVRLIASRTGAVESAEALMETKKASLAARLDKVRRGFFSGRGAALFVDPYVAPGFTNLLTFLGFDVRLCGLRPRSDARAQAARERLAALKNPPVVIHDPELGETRRLLEAGIEAGEIDVVIGSAFERDAAEGLNVAFYEWGYPSLTRHCVSDSPLVGFAGVLKTADQLLNLLTERDRRGFINP